MFKKMIVGLSLAAVGLVSSLTIPSFSTYSSTLEFSTTVTGDG